MTTAVRSLLSPAFACSQLQCTLRQLDRAMNDLGLQPVEYRNHLPQIDEADLDKIRRHLQTLPRRKAKDHL